jgi:hypothetical protein
MRHKFATTFSHFLRDQFHSFLCIMQGKDDEDEGL